MQQTKKLRDRAAGNLARALRLKRRSFFLTRRREIEARKCEAIVEHYLLLMRQRLLWIPSRVRARFKQTDLVDFISNEIDAALNELADLPEAVASGRVVSYARDPESVEGNGNGHELTMTRKVSKRDRARYPRD